MKDKIEIRNTRRGRVLSVILNNVESHIFLGKEGKYNHGIREMIGFIIVFQDLLTFMEEGLECSYDCKFDMDKLFHLAYGMTVNEYHEDLKNIYDHGYIESLNEETE